MIRRVSRSWPLLAASLALALAVGPVAAADFGVVPLKVLLSQAKTTEVLTIRNNATTPLRLQVEGKTWGMDASKQWKLDDTDDLIFSPEILSIAPNAEATLRVGTLAPADATEVSYRLLLTEIRDSSQAPANGLNLNVRTQVSLPVFVDPTGAASKAALTGAERRDNTLRLTVSNSGNARIDAQGMGVELLDSAGKVIETAQATSSYALAGAAVDVDVQVKPTSCKAATQVRLTLTAPVVTLTHDLPASAQSCGGASS
jgi:fimbrial chaperone protein